MEIKKPIQVIYAPGTFGNCVRWMFDRFTSNSKFTAMESPWDDTDRAHGFFGSYAFNERFKRSHQIDDENSKSVLDPSAYKVIISYDTNDLLFVERCGYYRNPGFENEKKRYDSIIGSADASFVKETFGSVISSKSVAKELLKIQFHDIENHQWWNSMKKLISNEDHHQFDLYSLWDHDRLKIELLKVSEKYTLNLNIDENVINNVVEKIKKSYPVITRKRAHHVLDAVNSKINIDCDDLDIMEQAYIEVELEKINDCVIFPYGTNWFADTKSIMNFLDTYPRYLKHMNPRLPWYNNIKNPFYLTGKIDENK